MSQIRSIADARQIAAEQVLQYEASGGEPLSIMDDHTQSFDDGWLFFYDTVEYIKTGNFSSRLAGNCPIFVELSGAVHLLPTHQTIETSLAAIRAKLSQA